jgi:hypothetical protein
MRQAGVILARENGDGGCPCAQRADNSSKRRSTMVRQNPVRQGHEIIGFRLQEFM